MAGRKYTAENLLAPYLRGRPSDFFDIDFVNGSYTLDIMGCNLTCKGCWSGFGSRERDPKWKLTPEQVVAKMCEGMKRNVQGAARISGGEALMYREHTRAVIDGFLTETADLVMDVPGVTARGGESLALIVETHGALLTEQYMSSIEQEWGRAASNVYFSIGVKATSAEGFAALTGMPLEVAKRNHEKQMAALRFILHECEHLNVFASFLDRYSDKEAYASLMREADRARPGVGRQFSWMRHRHYPNVTKHYVPKRFRVGEHPEEVPADDAEKLVQLASMDVDLPELVEIPQDADRDTPQRRQRLAQAERVKQQKLPEGRLRAAAR